MYECLCVRMYLYTYVFMHVCLYYVCLYVCAFIYVSMNVCMSLCTCAFMYVHVCMYLRMYISMYVSLYGCKLSFRSPLSHSSALSSENVRRNCNPKSHPILASPPRQIRKRKEENDVSASATPTYNVPTYLIVSDKLSRNALSSLPRHWCAVNRVDAQADCLDLTQKSMVRE